MLCHISHVYETGASLYFTIATRQDDRPRGAVACGQGRGVRRDIRNGASITHHHAVGQDHKPWLAEEIGPVGSRCSAQ